MSLKKQVVHGLVWTSLQGAGTQIISFAVFLVLARLLDPESFGLVAMAAVAVAFFKIFSNFGFGAAIVQRENLEPGHLDTAFFVDLLVGIVMMTISFFSAGAVANLYGEPRIEIIMQALALLFLPSALCQVQINVLRRNLNFRPLAIRTLTAEAVGGVIGVACAISGLGVWSLVARQLTTAFVAATVLWILSDWRPGLAASKAYFQDLFGFSVKMLGANIVAFLSNKSDTFLIGYFLGPVSLGYYTIALRLISILIEFLGGTINKVAWPAFARLQNNPEKMRSGFYSASQLLGLIVMPIFLGIFATASKLVPFTFGDKWGPSIAILEILAFLAIIHSMSKMYDSIMVSIGRPGLWLYLRIAIGFSNILGFFVGLQWGLTGVAFAYTAVAYIYLPVYLYALHKLIDINVCKYFNVLAAPVFSAAFMAFIVLATSDLLENRGGNSMQLAILICVGIISYSLILVLVSPATTKKLFETVNEQVRNMKSRKE